MSRRRRAGVGKPDGEHGDEHHHDPRDRRHHVRQGQRRRAPEPGRASACPRPRPRQASGSSSPPTTLHSPRSSWVSARTTSPPSWLLKGPLSLGHPRTLDGYRRRRHRRDADLGRKQVHVVLYVRAAGHPRPGRGGLGRREGPAHSGRTRHVLEVGRARAPPGTPGHRLDRARQRRLTGGHGRRTPVGDSRPPDPARRRRRGRLSPVPYRPSRRPTRRRAGASRRVKVMRPLRHIPVRTAATAGAIAAARRAGDPHRSGRPAGGRSRNAGAERPVRVQGSHQGRRQTRACTSSRRPDRAA